MARSQSSPLLLQLKNANSLLEEAAALQALKNELVGHLQRKEAWIGLGILTPIVATLRSKSSNFSGKDVSMKQVASSLSKEDFIKLQALQLVACLANGGPAFLSPIHAAGVVPAILGNFSTNSNPPQIVKASLRALVDISAAASLASPSSPFNTRTLADHVFTSYHIESLNAILSMTSSNDISWSQVTLVSTLICRLCCEERHQNALVASGILDSLASRLASFAVASGLVLPGADRLAREDGLRDIIPGPAPATAKIGPVLEAISAVIGDSRYRAHRLVYSPVLLATFPSIKLEAIDDSYNVYRHGGTVMDCILPPLPTATSWADSAHHNVLSMLDGPESRASSSKTPLHKMGTAMSWDSPRHQSWGDISAVTNEEIESPLIPWLVHLVRSLNDYDRLMAAAVLSALFKAGLCRRGVREQTFGLLVVPILVSVIARSDGDDLEVSSSSSSSAKRRRLLEKGTLVLARFITDSEHLQRAANDGNAVKILSKLLKRSYSPTPDTPPPSYWSPSPDTGMRLGPESSTTHLGDRGLDPILAHKIALREASLKAIGALAAGREDHRKALVAEGVIPYIVESLCEFPRKPKLAKDKAANEMKRTAPVPEFGTNPVSVIIAACHAVRTLARSVSILRTALMDYAVALPIYHFLRHPDVNVQIAATAAVINLVVEVSPVRETFTENGAMEILCNHAHSNNPALRLNALWALKHFVDAVGPELKKACLAMLGPDWLVRTIRCDSQDSSLSVFRINEVAGDDGDEDMDTHALDEPLRWLFSVNGKMEELIALHSTRLRQAEDKLMSVRESELNPARKARSDDMAIQEQGLDFIRNLIGRPEPGSSSEAPSETTEMIDHLFQEIGQDRLFDMLASKLRSRVLRPFGRRDSTASRESRVAYPQARIVVAVICILVHLAASNPRHRQIVIAQTELLKLLAQQTGSKDRGVRASLCHLVINLTWQEDDGEAQACSQRAHELKKLGYYTKMDFLRAKDNDLDVRERAKTAAWQIEQATY